jgi:tetratricopeptide (TPR) repeat protein
VPGSQTGKTPEQFPFPGDVAPAAKVLPAASGAADQFPYPGETAKSPDAAPEGDAPRYVPEAPAGEDSSSSSGSSSSSNSQPGSGIDEAKADESEPAAKSVRRKLPKVSAKTVDERVSEDLEVARFYADHGNYLAAYLRSRDATKLMPEDPESHFSLGQAAAKLGKKEEAATEFAVYLKLDPVGEKRRAAEQALGSLK